MSDNQALILALASTIPLYFLLKPLLGKSQIPTVPGGKWLTGHTDTIFSNPVEFMRECREKYGSLYTIRHLGKDIVVFGKEWIDELFKNKDVDFETAINEAFLAHEILGGAEYMHHPKINTPKIVRSMITPFLKDYNARILEQIYAVNSEILEEKDSVAIESPSELMRRIVVKATCSIMLGNRLSEDEELIEAFYEYPLKVETSAFTKFKYTKYPIIGRWYARYLIDKEKIHLPYLELFTDRVTKEINLRKKQEELGNYQKPDDMLQKLIDDDFSIKEISITCLGLIFASVMTTTANSTMALYDMVTYPQHVNDLIEEQLQVQKEFGDELSTENLSKMSKLNSFIRETMRFRLGGIANFRYTTADWTLSNGITLPKGTFLGVDTFSLAYDNELQDGSPYEFTPFRHAANGKLATKVEPQNIIFGLGQHACPGRFLAVQEIMTILSFILRNYKVSTVDGKPHPYMVIPITFGLPKGEPLVFTKLNSK